jgi:hypothetical protein
MAHRTFTDAGGRDWQVWEVRPGRAVLGDAADRRDRGSDRRVAVAVDAAAHWRASGQPERRVRHERRVGVSAPLRDGWLAFLSGDERRRLAPIPHGWEDDSDVQLAAYCRAARVVGGGTAAGAERGRRYREE